MSLAIVLLAILQQSNLTLFNRANCGTADPCKKTFESIQHAQHSRSGVDNLTPFDDYPFLIYALSNWSYHVSHAPADSHDLLEKTLRFLESCCLLWINGVALTRNLRVFIKTSENLKTFLKRRAMAERKRPPTSYPTRR